MTMKYDNEHDAYLFDGASSGAVRWDGNPGAPTGQFAEITLWPGGDSEEETAAAAFYGTEHLIIQEGADGTRYVHRFPDQQSLNARLLILERAWRMWEHGYTNEQVIAVHRGFTRALADAIGMPGLETEWSVDAQRETREIVIDWLLDNHGDVVEYMRLPYENVYSHGRATWEDVGFDLAKVIQRQGFEFTVRVGPADCAAEMNRSALLVPVLTLVVNESGVIEVAS